MANKLYLKDFIEILDEADYHFNNLGWENILNIMAIKFFKDAKEARDNGYEYSADSYERIATGICDAMERRGIK